jgi:hypothetical protein
MLIMLEMRGINFLEFVVVNLKILFRSLFFYIHIVQIWVVVVIWLNTLKNSVIYTT